MVGVRQNHTAERRSIDKQARTVRGAECVPGDVSEGGVFGYDLAGGGFCCYHCSIPSFWGDHMGRVGTFPG